MNKNKRSKSFLAVIAAFLIALAMLRMPAYAASRFDPEHDSALTVECSYNFSPLEGVSFDIHRVADMTAQGGFVITDTFADCSIDLHQQDSAGWRMLAETICAFIQLYQIPPLSTVSTDQDGMALFEGLSPAMYLVCGEQFVSNGFIYTPEPFLISLPQQDENNEWCYEIGVSCKGEGCEESPDPIDISVLKLWEDQGTGAIRPASITVLLLCDGVIFDSAVLSEENGWYHIWRDLEAAHDWRVIEQNVPEGYSLLISREGWVFVLTNTCSQRLTELFVQKVWDDAGNEHQRPVRVTVQLLRDGEVYDTVTLSEATGWSYHWVDLDDSYIWTVREQNVPPGYTVTVTEQGVYYYIVNTYKPIPQTGQLWWPIPVLICFGFIFLIWAVLKGKGSE